MINLVALLFTGLVMVLRECSIMLFNIYMNSAVFNKTHKCVDTIIMLVKRSFVERVDATTSTSCQ